MQIPTGDLRVLRRADDAASFAGVQNPAATAPALPAGDYRLTLTFRRAAQGQKILSQADATEPEEATIDVPWPEQA
jgi:hypothetical protein